MIEVLTLTHVATCKHCDRRIVLYLSDMRAEPYWSHSWSGQVPCVTTNAEPRMSSVVPLPPTDAQKDVT